MLSLYEIRRLMSPDVNNEPGDDFRILQSWAEYDTSSSKAPDEKNLEYMCYELEVMNPDTGERTRFYKAIKFARVIRLPADAKQSTAFMDMQEGVLAAAYSSKINLITVIANMIKPEPIGLLYLYGVQATSKNLDDAKLTAKRDFLAFVSSMQGTFRVLEMRCINAQESEWLREKMYNMDYMTVVRGIPRANKAGEDAGNKGIGGTNLNPDSEGTLEELIIGMADYEYILEILSTPVFEETLEGWQRESQNKMTEWYSQLQGQTSMNFSLSIPMMYMANASQSQGWSKAYTDAKSVSSSSGESFSTSQGQSVGESLSQSFGRSVGQSSGTSLTNSYSQGVTHSQGVSFGESYGQNQSVSHNISSGASQNFGQSYGVSQNTNTGLSQGTNASQSFGTSQGSSFNISQGQNTSTSHNVTSGQSIGYSQNQSVSLGNTASVGQSAGSSTSVGMSSGASSGSSYSVGTSDGSNRGWSGGGSWSMSDGAGASDTDSIQGGVNVSVLGTGANGGVGHSDGVNISITAGNSYNESASLGTSHSQNVNNGASFSQNWGSSVGNSVNSSNSTTMGASRSASTGYGLSQNASVSESYGVSSGQSLSNGWGVNSSENQSYSLGNSYGLSNSIGNGVSQSVSQSYGLSQSEGYGESYGTSYGVNYGTSESVSQSETLGQSLGQSYTNSVTDSATTGYGQNVSNSESVSNGQSYSVSNGTSQGTSSGSTGTSSIGTSSSMGLGPSIGYSKSHQWINQGVKDLLELLEFQNERIKKSLRGQGAFYTYCYLACPSLDALAVAQTVAKSTWQNDFAMTQPLQVLDLSETEQKHLLYHFEAFSSDVSKEDVFGVREYKYCTVLLPEEYVAYTHLPRISEGGIFSTVQDIPKFAVRAMMSGEIYMGTILNPERYSFMNGYRTQNDYRIAEETLMHGFFTGASRSGKTVAAMRFIAELAQVRRKSTGKRLRIVVLDPKQDWRTLARFVEPERFNFYSMGNPNYRPIHINPWKVPHGVWPQIWIDGVIDIYCRAYGLLERGKQMIADVVYDLYTKAGVFTACDKPDWADTVPELSANVSFEKIYKQMEAKRNELSGNGKGGNDTKDAYARLVERLSCFGRAYSIENKLYGSTDGMAIDELIGDDDVTVLESKGLENTFKNFIFGVVTSGFYKYALAHEGGYLAPDQYETVLVIEEANEVLTGNDTAGGGSDMHLSGQSEFEQILDQSAGYGLFIFAITQKIADMPSSIIANCGMVFAGKLKRPDDINVVVRAVGREERIDDRDLVKWFPRSPTGWFVCQTSRTFDFKDAEPILVQIARLPITPPKNYELDSILLNKEISHLDLDYDREEIALMEY